MPAAINAQASLVVLKPSNRITPSDLPPELSQSLSGLQRNGLAFAIRKLRVVSAHVQSFQTGSISKGSINLIGAERALGEYWSILGATGSINQQSVSQYRTDVQIKLEDRSGEKYFLNYSLPFAITLSIDPGENLELYFVKGGLRKTFTQTDYRCNDWVTFAGRNSDTGQLLPIGFLPSLNPPSTSWLTAGVVVGIIGLAFTAWQMVSPSIFFLALAAIFIVVYAAIKQRYLKDFRKSAEESATGAV